MSARPHHVGSPYDKDNAEWLLARFKEWGWDAQIETFSVLFPTPTERVLELVEPTRFTARLEEPVVAVDPTSNQKSEQLPTYNAYSIDGDVTGAARLRELRPSRGLRGARPLRHFRQGRDRHRALRRIVARHQAEGRGGTRRDRLPDLLGSARTTALPSATCFRRARCAQPTARSAAA